MTRRTFIRSGVAIGTAIALGRRAAVPRERKYGLIVAGKHPYGGVRCWLDDVEVTNSAFAADDREGWAKLWKRKPNGVIEIIIVDGRFRPAFETLYGAVRFEIA